MMIFAWVLTAMAFLGGLFWTYHAASNSQDPSMSVQVWMGLLLALVGLGQAFMLVIVMAP